MKLPYLKQWDNAECRLSLHDVKPSENGDFPVVVTYSGRCNLSEKAITVRNPDGEYVRLNCILHIHGDVAPALVNFSGTAEVNGKSMKIETVDRPRNPDGTVHHTRLGLI